MLGDKPLPAITLFVIGVSSFMQNHWAILLGAVVGIIVAYKVAARTGAGRAILDRVKLRAPLFGDLIRKTSISRFSRTLGTLVTSGVPILEVVHLAGYFDQPHLTRSLGRFIGQTPAQLLHHSRPEQLSFLYKTTPFP